MLFLHGYPEFWYSWRHQLKEFSTDYWWVQLIQQGSRRDWCASRPLFQRTLANTLGVWVLKTSETVRFSEVVRIFGIPEINRPLMKQDRQCTCNVTMRPVRLTIVVVEKQKYYILWVCVCSLRYLEFNAHGPYCYLCPVRLYFIFPHYLINGTFFGGKKCIEHKMCVLISIKLFPRNIFIRRRPEWDMIVNVYWSMQRAGNFCHILMKIEFSRLFFRKIHQYQIPWTFDQWEPSCSVLTDRQTWRS